MPQLLKNYLTLKIVFFLFITFSAKSQVFTDSNLPIVIITTDNGAEIPDEPKIGASMQIVYRGVGLRNYVTDVTNPSYLNYEGRIGIEVRGAGSAGYPQKPFGIETRLADNITSNNVSILEMPAENDWILLPLYLDTSLMRDYLAYHLSRQLGDYASRGKYVEVVLNGTFQGLYILEEKIKLDKNRVDILELLPTEITVPSLTGGYLVQEDDEGTIRIPHKANTVINPIVIEEPSDYTQTNIDYCKAFLLDVDAICQTSNLANIAVGYPSKIDVYSFYNYMLMTEFMTNPDSYTRSTYYHKDRNGKLVFGPVWDFNIAMGNNSDNGKYNMWEIDYGFFQGPRFLTEIFEEPNFRCHLAKRWQELRQPNKPFDLVKINFTVDSLASVLEEAQIRHFNKWNGLGICQPGTSGCLNENTFLEKIAYLKQFLTNRAQWIDANILPGYTQCSYPTLPNLVINEIMYNPFFVASNTSLGNISAKKQAINATADDYEFIEIKNNETISVDLTGLYFRGGGIVYQFPPNTNIAAGAIIVIASNALEFEARYGFAPFGQFTRDLSNTGEKIILADAMGNIIDEVTYSNQSPWPNAYGKSLELKTSNLDNTLAVNWFQQPVNGGSPGVENVYVAPDPCLEPKNVIINEINYNSLSTSNSGDWVEIYNSEAVSLDLSNWQLKDFDHTFLIPPGTILPAKGYLVICDVPLNFANNNPTITNYLNVSMNFGLGNGGEIVQLLDQNSCLIDELTFDDVAPWPITPDGQGFTLSLKSPSLDNSLGENWAASTAILGTPGAFNFENTALPVKIKDFFGENADTETKLIWLVTDENNINKYEIEWSENAKSFQKIGEILAGKFEKYQFSHESFPQNLNYFRLKILEENGKYFYSKIIAILNQKENKIEVYPNPATNNFYIKLNTNYLQSTLTYSLFDQTGKKLISKTFIPQQLNETINTSSLPTGKYFLQIVNNYGQQFYPIIIQK